MGLHPQTIGAGMPHGFAGSYARQPDMIINTRPAGGADPVPFGAALEYDAKGAAVPCPLPYVYPPKSVSLFRSSAGSLRRLRDHNGAHKVRHNPAAAQKRKRNPGQTHQGGVQPKILRNARTHAVYHFIPAFIQLLFHGNPLPFKAPSAACHTPPGEFPANPLQSGHRRSPGPA